MASHTPSPEMHTSEGTSLATDDSGYLTSTPSSTGSLRGRFWSSQKVRKFRKPISSTPASLSYASETYKRNIPVSKFTYKSTSPLSDTDIANEASFPNESPLWSRPSFKELLPHRNIDEVIGPGFEKLSPHHNDDELMSIDCFIDSQVSNKHDGSDTECEMEIDEEGSVFFNNEAEIALKDDVKSEYQHEDLSHGHEACSQDSGIYSQSNVSFQQLHTESSDLETDRLMRFTKKNLSNESLTYNDSQESMPPVSKQFSLKFSSRRALPCFTGRERIDFLTLLGERSDHKIIIGKILSYLEPINLTAVAVVSKTWNRISSADRNAYRRKQLYLEKKQNNKENWSLLQAKKLESPAVPGHSRSYLGQIQNVNKSGSNQTERNPPSPPTSPSKRRFLQFLKAAQNLEQGKNLAPCPRCFQPSQIDGTSRLGQCVACSYTFCCLCRSDSHGMKPCPSSVSARSKKRLGSIGSKESKKNLRRLLDR